MNQITKWVAVAVLVTAGFAYSGTTASAAERAVPIKAGYRVHRGGPIGGWNYGHYRYYSPWHYRWHRR